MLSLDNISGKRFPVTEKLTLVSGKACKDELYHDEQNQGTHREQSRVVTAMATIGTRWVRQQPRKPPQHLRSRMKSSYPGSPPSEERGGPGLS